MTIEQLKKGSELLARINTVEAFQSAFHEPCRKTVSAYSVSAEKAFSLSVEENSELYGIIDDYIGKELEEAKNQFEEI